MSKTYVITSTYNPKSLACIPLPYLPLSVEDPLQDSSFPGDDKTTKWKVPESLNASVEQCSSHPYWTTNEVIDNFYYVKPLRFGYVYDSSLP